MPHLTGKPRSPQVRSPLAGEAEAKPLTQRGCYSLRVKDGVIPWKRAPHSVGDPWEGALSDASTADSLLGLERDCCVGLSLLVSSRLRFGLVSVVFCGFVVLRVLSLAFALRSLSASAM